MIKNKKYILLFLFMFLLLGLVNIVSAVITQSGNVTLVGTTINIPINEVVIADTFVVVGTINPSDSLPQSIYVTPNFVNNSLISVTRFGSGVSQEVLFRLIEDSNFDVQHIEITFSSGQGSSNVPITPVNLSKAFVVVSARTNSGDELDNIKNFYTVNFTSSSNVLVTRDLTGVESTLFIQVGELTGAVTQSGTTNLSDGSTSVAESINSVVIDESFILFSQHGVGSNTGQDTNHIRVNFTSTSEITFRRGGTDIPDERHIEWFVVSIPNVKVQHGEVTVSSTTPISTIIDEINVSQSFLITSLSSTSIGTSWQDSGVITSINSSTTLETIKGTATDSVTVNFQVVEFLDGFAPPPTPSPPTTPFVGLPSSEALDFWHYQKTQLTLTGLVSTGFNGLNTGNWVDGINPTVFDIIRGRGVPQQVLISDLDNDSIKELYIVGDENTVFVYVFNETLNIFQEKDSFTTSGGVIMNHLNIHQFPNKQLPLLVVGSRDNGNWGVEFINFSDGSLNQVCGESGFTNGANAGFLDYGTACYEEHCILIGGDDRGTLVNSSCEETDSFVTGQPLFDIMLKQTPVIVDQDLSTDEVDIFFLTDGDSTGLDIQRWKYNITDGVTIGSSASSTVVDEVWDSKLYTSLISVDADLDGDFELITMGSNLNVILFDNYASIKAIRVEDFSTLWGEGVNSNPDINGCRGANANNQVTLFQPALFNHPDGTVFGLSSFSAVCGACIIENEPTPPRTTSMVFAKCWDILNGDELVELDCLGAGELCQNIAYTPLGAFSEIERPNILTGNFDDTDSNHELLIGNVLVQDDLQPYELIGSDRFIFSSMAHIKDNGVDDINFIFANNSGSFPVKVYDTNVQNTPPVINSVSSCPQLPICLSSANTTGVKIEATFSDVDNDDLEWNITNTTDSGFSNYISDGGTGAMETFLIFNTIGNKVVTLNVRDTDLNVDTQDIQFSIIDATAPVCNIDFNFCSTTNTTPVVPINVTIEGVGILNVRQGLENTAQSFNLPIQVFLLLLIIAGVLLTWGITENVFVSSVVGLVIFFVGISFNWVSGLVLFMITIFIIGFVVFTVFWGNVSGGNGNRGIE